MLVIDARNINDAWSDAKLYLNKGGRHRGSRAGTVVEYPDPVTTRYSNPRERVLFNAKRDCNPFFHFFESLWILAGRNDVAWISQFNQRMMSFSDDGHTYHAAYGHRWRWHFAAPLGRGGAWGALDQLPRIVELLKNNHDERRAVLQMWDPEVDLGHNGKDLPCNTAVYFKIREDKLYMTVTNRSNDIVWGCYGANVVQMSVLQEYMAAQIGVEVGPYHQVSDSWHAYTEYWEKYGGNELFSVCLDPYVEHPYVEPYPLVKVPIHFDSELQYWMAHPAEVMEFSHNPLFNEVAVPMYRAWCAHKSKNYDYAYDTAELIQASDWRMACKDWFNRRAEARLAVEVAA